MAKRIAPPNFPGMGNLLTRITLLRRQEESLAEERKGLEKQIVDLYLPSGKGTAVDTKAGLKVSLTENPVFEITDVEALKRELGPVLFGMVTVTKLEYSRSGYKAALAHADAHVPDGDGVSERTRLDRAVNDYVSKRLHKPSMKIEAV